MDRHPTVLDSEEGKWICRGAADASWVREASLSFAPLLLRAREAKSRGYAPYSGFLVGCALVMDGRVFEGCNVENASYGATLCAERGAIAAAVAAGARRLEILALSTSAAPGAPPGERAPCGVCRQVVGEFAEDRALVLLDAGTAEDGRIQAEVVPFETLLPWRFRLRA